MAPVFLPDLRLNAEISGPEGAPALVLIHALGLNLRLWDDLVARLPEWRILRLDLRGHGLSDVPPAPYAMGALIRDTERLIEHFGLTETVTLGLSIGGLVAQGLAVKRLDLVRGLILSNTAAKIGTAPQWQARIEEVAQGGIAAITDATLQRWFGHRWREADGVERARQMLMACNPEGWIGCAHAIAGTDFYETTATLRLPTLVIAGGNDGSTPADLVRETADLIPGHRFALIRGAGHLPMLDRPEDYAATLRDFLTAIGHHPG